MLLDLSNPLINAPGNPAEARQRYEEAKSVLGPAPADDNPLLATTAPYLYAELDEKLALLP